MTALPVELAKIRETAREQRGKREDPKGSNRGEIDIYRPDWKRDDLLEADRRAGKLTKGDAWCAWFATWVWFTTLGRHPLGRQVGSVYALAVRAQELGLFIPLSGKKETDTAFVAYPGCAFILLDKPIREGWSEGHTGIIDALSDDGWSCDTTEGNTGDAVREGRRELWDPRMRGIVTPLGLEHITGDWPRGLKSKADVTTLGTR